MFETVLPETVFGPFPISCRKTGDPCWLRQRCTREAATSNLTLLRASVNLEGTLNFEFLSLGPDRENQWRKASFSATPKAFRISSMMHQAGRQRARQMISESISAKQMFATLEEAVLLHPMVLQDPPMLHLAGPQKTSWERATQTMCSIAGQKRRVRIQCVENLGDQNESATQALVSHLKLAMCIS